MPCFVTGSRSGDIALAMQESKKKLQEEVTELTQLLCATLGSMKSHKKLPKEVSDWWKKHQKVDEGNKTLKRRSLVKRPNKKENRR